MKYIIILSLFFMSAMTCASDFCSYFVGSTLSTFSSSSFYYGKNKQSASKQTMQSKPNKPLKNCLKQSINNDFQQVTIAVIENVTSPLVWKVGEKNNVQEAHVPLVSCLKGTRAAQQAKQASQIKMHKNISSLAVPGNNSPVSIDKGVFSPVPCLAELD